jgi:hypothetical protein
VAAERETPALFVLPEVDHQPADPLGRVLRDGDLHVLLRELDLRPGVELLRQVQLAGGVDRQPRAAGLQPLLLQQRLDLRGGGGRERDERQRGTLAQPLAVLGLERGLD